MKEMEREKKSLCLRALINRQQQCNRAIKCLYHFLPPIWFQFSFSLAERVEGTIKILLNEIKIII